MAVYLVKMKMQGRKKVYVETSVVSNLTARRSLNIVDLARQVATQQWWDDAVHRMSFFLLFLYSVRRKEVTRMLPLEG